MFCSQGKDRPFPQKLSDKFQLLSTPQQGSSQTPAGNPIGTLLPLFFSKACGFLLLEETNKQTPKTQTKNKQTNTKMEKTPNTVKQVFIKPCYTLHMTEPAVNTERERGNSSYLGAKTKNIKCFVLSKKLSDILKMKETRLFKRGKTPLFP